MRLLVVTQVVDRDDPILGFFTRWLEEFAVYAEQVEVICLRKGTYHLPQNANVYSLGKEEGVSRLTYLIRFYTYLYERKGSYDAVFVHMNPEYVVLGGLMWRLWGKKIALWYTHKSVTLWLRLAERLAHLIFTASQESFRLKSTKVHILGHGIDVDFFSPDPNALRSDAVLSVGRLSPAKRHDLVIRALALLPNPLWIVGDGPERGRLESLSQELGLGSRAHFFGGHTQTDLLEEYRHAGVFAHTSETGSLDKVVLEALACGLPVVTTSTALSALPVTRAEATPEALARGIKMAAPTPPEPLTAYVREHHSLTRLIPAILGKLSP